MAIQRLDDTLVSQIAAGEVVERPASIVKELMENALDAGATSIEVIVEEGGLRRIAVIDDGCGIAANEVPLALARHATSKIDSLSALESVGSLGFRGEALASMASVAELTLTSRTRDAPHASEIAAARETVVRPAAGEYGTRVEVRELFARIPARRKFLRAPPTEFKHVRQAFQQLALSRFDVAFKLSHGGVENAALPVATDEAGAKRRVASVLGAEFDDHAVAVDEAAAGMRLTGWIATPGFSRGQADRQYSYVNNRPIRDKVFNHAVRLAYRDLLHNQRHPAYALYLSVDPRQVDVNAHPAKAEVRFRQSRLVHDFVFRSVSRALAAVEAKPHEARTVDLSPSPGSAAESPRPAMTPRGFDFRSERSGVSERAAAYRFQAPDDTPASTAPAAADHAPTTRAPGTREATDIAPAAAASPSAGEAASLPETDATPALGYAIGQLHDIYILAQNAEGLVLVDMHAAHERVLYEQLKAEFSAGTIQCTHLLVPETLSLSESEAATVESASEALSQVGFEITQSGPTEALLRGVPTLMADRDYLALARDVIAEIDDGARGADTVRDALDDVLADIGCKAAVKAGRRLTLDEMNALLRDMEHTDRAGHCNHGRPSWVSVDRAGLDRLFMRGK
ncbi:DNA mismatch repair endonuclease MutL [Salinisphaera sp. Q1T1-3]|uniref:DNA mismatch repair endonuclease MutL n=1 Tax=Salinisphaera sp. Q1T1-3 TaxID=2321229 RepID=UPI000E76BF4F|nr:DNA mismatch repair endonuclease MutL [Salinisphaera sp. Q1T1-3]RJS93790.1 DNA mismatch repair endonuclease MutL [Salinisphaera sp. Q1T1-3]